MASLILWVGAADPVNKMRQLAREIIRRELGEGGGAQRTIAFTCCTVANTTLLLPDLTAVGTRRATVMVTAGSGESVIESPQLIKLPSRVSNRANRKHCLLVEEAAQII